ncbi:MAG: tRNA (guanine-N7)-methyltransferase [Polyangiaceae bacterium]
MRDYPYEHAPRLPDSETIDPRSLLGGEAPVELEIGPGRGWFMVERVENDASARILGLEVKLKWATIVDERLKQRGFGDRARVFAEDVARVLPRFTPASLSRVYIHFPDPWWKKRHRKRLVVRDEVIREVVRTLVPGGELFVQTDVEERAEAYQMLLDRVLELAPAPGGPRIEDNPFGARSPRERKAIQDELPVFRLLYRRRSDS